MILSIHLALACRVDWFLLFRRQWAKQIALQEFQDFILDMKEFYFYGNLEIWDFHEISILAWVFAIANND